jgi:hypothetical protein
MNMNTKKFIPYILFVLIGLLTLSGCAKPQPAGLTDDQVVAITENMLAAINNDDYAAFSRDFSAGMLSAFAPAQFEQLRDLLMGASGNFVSMGTPTLSNSQGYAIYRIQCPYEKEDVVVMVSFQVGGDQVEGLWFDSPNLRAASQ